MDDEILDIFCEEAEEHLTALEQGFLDLERSSEDDRRPLVDALFRHAHSLKGDARAMGVQTLQQSAQLLEDLLDTLRDDPDTLSKEIIDRGLTHFDEVRSTYEAWKNAGSSEPEPPQVEADVPIVTEPVVEEASPEPEPQEEPTPEPVPEPASRVPVEESFTVRVRSEQLDALLNTASELRTSRGGRDFVASGLAGSRTSLVRLLGDIRRLERIGTTLGEQSFRERTLSMRNSIEGILERVGELERADRKQRSHEKILMEGLEADIRSIRMLPFSVLTDPFRRTVRELADRLGKRVRLETEVDDVQLDKAVLESLKAPLAHLLSNAVDHGIESPDERLAKGKPEEGCITLRTVRSKTGITLFVEDDGSGIDYARIRSRLKQRRHLDESAIDALSEEELARHLFEPGFTTTESPTAVSGRGVGLDVVWTAIQNIHGRIVVETNADGGTTFRLAFPLTVATIRVLTVRSGGQHYGIPSRMLQRIGRASGDDLDELEGRTVLNSEQGPLRWVGLGALLGQPTKSPLGAGESWPYFVIEQGGNRVAVHVDDWEDEREVLLKPLGFPLKDLPGVMGATFRPDGTVQLVLDLGQSMFHGSAGPKVVSAPASEPAAILLVDDSPTTRTIMRNVFVAAGYRVQTAADGVDALDKLRTASFELVVSDVEMPRMDGFELTRQVKMAHGLPVVLVTGLEKEPYRRKGLEAGADAYVVKSTFEGAGLLEIVEQLVG